MKVDKTGKDFIQSNYSVFDTDIEKYEYLINDLVRVPINVSRLTQNNFNALVSIAIGVGKEVSTTSNLIKYINMLPNISTITIGNTFTLESIEKFLKAGIAYWILNSAINTEELVLRKKEIKLYFS